MQRNVVYIVVILLSKVRVSWCFLLFLLVFGLWQAMHVLIHFFMPPYGIRALIYLAIQVISLSVSVLLIKRKDRDFQEHGFWWPENPGIYIAVSMLLAMLYGFITIFPPGSFMGFELSPLNSQLPLEIVNALLAAVASESIFRGYIQRDLTRAYGFLPALCIGSVMFSLHAIPLTSIPELDSNYIFTEISSLFIKGVFLGLFFQVIRTLVCPVTFHVVLLLQNLTPLKAAATGYVALFFQVIAYSFLTLLLYILLEKKYLELPEIKKEQATQK